MCYASPGPRCPKYVRETRAKVTERLKAARVNNNTQEVSELTDQLIELAKDYLYTAENIRKQKALGNTLLAQKLARKRKEMIQASKDAKIERDKAKALKAAMAQNNEKDEPTETESPTSQRTRPNPADYGFTGGYPENSYAKFGSPETYFNDLYANIEEKARDRADKGLLPHVPLGDKWQKWQEENEGLALTPVDDAPAKVKVYRAGKVTPSEYTGEIALHADEADYHRPDGADPRHGSLYASVDGKGMHRWMRGRGKNTRDMSEANPVSLEVNPNEARVYHVPTWDDVSDGRVHPKTFWQSGMLLSRFMEVAEKEGWNTSEWEVIVSPDKVHSKNMSAKAVTDLLSPHMKHDDERRNLNATMKKVQAWRRGAK